jgi:redox-sensitive bicupin YhaK (pirin superfamily)
MRHTPPEFAEITPELRERLEKFRTEHANDPLGKVADHVLYEDDDVRVWEMTLEPGQHTDLHRHDHDYILVIDSGDLVAGIPPKETGAEPFVGKIPPAGNTVRVPKGGIEWALNVGTKRYHEILIELKKT